MTKVKITCLNHVTMTWIWFLTQLHQHHIRSPHIKCGSSWADFRKLVFIPLNVIFFTTTHSEEASCWDFVLSTVNTMKTTLSYINTSRMWISRYLDPGVHFLVFVFGLVVRPGLLLYMSHAGAEGPNKANKDRLTLNAPRTQLTHPVPTRWTRAEPTSPV